jgi:hypothetical protein
MNNGKLPVYTIENYNPDCNCNNNYLRLSKYSPLFHKLKYTNNIYKTPYHNLYTKCDICCKKEKPIPTTICNTGELFITEDTTYVVPKCVKKIKFVARGGGGGGGEGRIRCTHNFGNGGGGGGSGYINEIIVNVNSGDIFKIIIGKGGLGGTNGIFTGNITSCNRPQPKNGENGGKTYITKNSFTIISSDGGEGGYKAGPILTSSGKTNNISNGGGKGYEGGGGGGGFIRKDNLPYLNGRGGIGDIVDGVNGICDRTQITLITSGGDGGNNIGSGGISTTGSNSDYSNGGGGGGGGEYGGKGGGGKKDDPIAENGVQNTGCGGGGGSGGRGEGFRDINPTGNELLYLVTKGGNGGSGYVIITPML